jgi:hypothetical protein
MLKKLDKTVLLAGCLAFCLPGLSIKPILAQAPSLADGILCVAKGKKTQGNRIYLYTSEIDDDSIKKKEPVSVTIDEPVATIDASELAVLNTEDDTLTIVDAVTGEPAEMKPVGKASTVYQGNNTFSGKTQAGTPVSFTLSSNYKTATIRHGNDTFKGSCH